MASENENETVAEIVKEMRAITFGEECCPDCGADFHRSNRWLEYADRIEAAHKRECELLSRQDVPSDLRAKAKGLKEMISTRRVVRGKDVSGV